MKTLLACMTLAFTPLIIGVGAATAQEPTEPDTTNFVGTWMGTLDIGAAQLRLRFVIAETESVLSATLYSVDQGNAQIQVAETTVSSDTISMAMPMVGASFRGTLSEEEGQITAPSPRRASPSPSSLNARPTTKPPRRIAPRTPRSPTRTSPKTSPTPTRRAATPWRAPLRGPPREAPSRP